MDEVEEEIKPSDELCWMLEIAAKEIWPNHEKIEFVNWRTKPEVKEVKIGAQLAAEEKEKLIKLLKKFVEMFSLSYLDMPGLNTNIIVHKLLLKKGCKLGKQKPRWIHPKIYLKVEEEIKK